MSSTGTSSEVVEAISALQDALIGELQDINTELDNISTLLTSIDGLLDSSAILAASVPLSVDQV